MSTLQGAVTEGSGAFIDQRLKFLDLEALHHNPWYAERYLRWVSELEYAFGVVKELAERQEQDNAQFLLTRVEQGVMSHLYALVGVSMVTFKFPMTFPVLADELARSRAPIQGVLNGWLGYSTHHGGRPDDMFKLVEDQMRRIILIINGEKLPLRS